MAATSDEGMVSLLTNFDQIFEDFKSGSTEIQSLRSNYDAEVKNREALEINCNSLKLENERLTKQYGEFVSRLADQLEQRAKCQRMEEDLMRISGELQRKRHEHEKMIELLKREHETKSGELEAQIGGFLLKKQSNEATIDHLRQDLAVHKAHIQASANRMERIHQDLESKYSEKMQDLKDCLLIEQEEKNELNKKLQNLEKELLFSRTKMVEQQRDLASSRNVEALKEKIMRLRKENEVLKRKLNDLKAA